jgi:DNA modification methylase
VSVNAIDTGAELEELLDRYQTKRRAISVNFRERVSWVEVGERATHYLHPYPAKLLPQIPIFFLSNTLLSKPGQTVLDPFCGSGTVLLESVLHGRHGIGTDANPLARLIASVKVARLSPNKLDELVKQVLQSAKRMRTAPIPDVVNIGYWFYPRAIDCLARLRRAIDNVHPGPECDFLRVCLSSTARRASRADPRVSVPVRIRPDQYPIGHAFHRSTQVHIRNLAALDVFALFQSVAQLNITRVRDLSALRRGEALGSVAGQDARDLRSADDLSTKLSDGSIDFIITSPPYAGAQKYIRSSSLSLGWLGLERTANLRALEDMNIGREHFPTAALSRLPATSIPTADRLIQQIAEVNKLRAMIAATYLLEMQSALTEAVRVLKSGGHMILVAANNKVCGLDFHTQRYLQQILEDLGLVTRLRLVDAIKSRGLMTRRNATASVITREWALLLQKP